MTDPSHPTSLVTLLCRRWRWWLLPMLVTLVVVLLVLWLGQQTTIAPQVYDLPGR